MAETIKFKRRLAGGSAGAPATLKTAEPAYNETDKVLYLGIGDDGSGNATSIAPIAGEGSYVNISGSQDISGVKNFTSSPDVPTRVTDDSSTKVASTAFVGAKIAAQAAPLAHVGSTGSAHGDATTSTSGFMSSTDKTKLDGVAINANNYAHPTGDGNLHVPATGTTSNKKVLTAGSTAGSASWQTLDLTYLPEASVKKSAKVATTTNLAATFSAGVLTNSGTLAALALDGISLASGDRVLVKDQTAALQNGIYSVTNPGTASVAWVLTRSDDADTSTKFAGSFISVDSGNTNGGVLYDTDFKSTDTLNTSAVTWNRVLDTGLASSVPAAAPGTAAAGTSINYARADHVHPLQTTVSGNADSATALATARSIGMTGDVTWSIPSFNGSANVTAAAALSTTGIAAGTYTKVTVDVKGRATAGSNLIAGDIPTLTSAKISDFDTQVRTNRLDQMAAPTAPVSINSQRISNVATPTADTDAATESYVDGVAQGLDVKTSVVAATTANITISAAQTIDGVSVVVGDRVLVKDQTASAQNGIYIVAAGAWTRAIDNNTWSELVSSFVFVEKGTTNAESGWVCTVDAGGTLGTTPISWSQFSGAGQIGAGDGLTKSGNTINVVGTTNRIIVNADSVDIAANYAGQATITTVGTVGTGTWNATAIAVAKGGTGLSAVLNGLVKGNGTAYSVAVAGTDYIAPGSTIDGGTF